MQTEYIHYEFRLEIESCYPIVKPLETQIIELNYEPNLELRRPITSSITKNILIFKSHFDFEVCYPIN